MKPIQHSKITISKVVGLNVISKRAKHTLLGLPIVMVVPDPDMVVPDSDVVVVLPDPDVVVGVVVGP